MAYDNKANRRRDALNINIGVQLTKFLSKRKSDYIKKHQENFKTNTTDARMTPAPERSRGVV